MDGKDKSFDMFIVFGGSEFEFQFAIVGFLCSVLPRRSFTAHRYENVTQLEKLEYGVAGILTALVWMKILWKNTPGILYRILYSCKNKLLGMMIWESVSDNFLRIIIKYGCKVEMNAPENDMGKVTSPDDIRCNGWEFWEIILYLGFSGNSLYFFSMHILLFEISWFYPVFSFLHQSKNIELFHQSSRTFVRPSERPG